MDSKTNTTKPEYPGLGIDFMSMTLDDAGRMVSHTNFDILPGDMFEGTETGTRMAFRIMAALEAMPVGHGNDLTRSVLREAFEILAGSTEERTHAHKWTAVGVVETFDRLIKSFARSGAWRSYLVECLTGEMDCMKERYDEYRADTQAFMSELAITPCKVQGGALSNVEAPQVDTWSDMTQSDRDAITDFESRIRAMSDMASNTDGRLVHILDSAADRFAAAADVALVDEARYILLHGEALIDAAYALADAEGQADRIDRGVAGVFLTLKEATCAFTDQFDVRGAIHERATERATQAQAKQSSSDARKAVAA